MDDLLKQLASLRFDITPTFDGRFIRFARLGGSEDKPNGWFIGREVEVDGQKIFTAHYGDQRTKEKYSWTSLTGKKLSPEESGRVAAALKLADQKNRAARDELQKRVAQGIQANLSNCITHGQSPYLARKGVGDSLYGCVLNPDDPEELVIPLRDIDGVVWSAQRIRGDGTKRYIKGGRKKGLFHEIAGAPGSSPIYICEGIATAASVHLATGCTVLVALDAENLDDVAVAVRSRYPDARLVIAGDNDLWKTKTGKPDGEPVNAGRDSAELAGKLAQALVVFPGFQAPFDAEPTDYNDLHAREGLARVRHFLDPSSQAGTSAALYSMVGGEVPASAAVGPGVITDGQEAGRGAFGPRSWRDSAGNRRLPSEQELATAALDVFGSDLIKQGRDLFRYSGGAWSLLTDEDLDQIQGGMQIMCGGHARLKLVQAAYKFFLMQAPARPRTVDLYAPIPNAANFRNGTLWLRRDPATFDYSLELCPHRREDYLINVLPYEYLPEDRSENPLLNEILARVFAGEPDEGEKLRALAQMYGACILPAFARLFLLWGEAQTGKSTLINLTSKLVDPANQGSVPPSEFTGFNLESLAGKLINVDADIPNDPLSDAMVKKIIDRRPFRIRRKGIKDLMAPIPAVHIFGANAIPPSYEGSNAMKRRWTFLHFKNVLPDSMVQSSHSDYWDIVYGRCPQGVLNFALMGLRDLVANKGHFLSPASSAESMDQWHREANPVAQFLHAIEQAEELLPNTKLLMHPDARIKCGKLWEVFEGWAEAGSLRISWLSKYKFYAMMRARGFRTVAIEGSDHFAGLGVEAAEGSQF